MPSRKHPMVVLINGDTASASEIVTAALEQSGTAKVVGTTSFGKGTFQEVIPLNNGGALDLTVGQYLTRNGTSINDVGIPPQVKAKDNPSTKPDEGLNKALQVLAPTLRRVVLVGKRGRFLVGELLFERGERIELGGGRRAATPGRMALVELGQGRGRARVVRELGDPGARGRRDRGDARGPPGPHRASPAGSRRRRREATERAKSLDLDRRDLRDLATFTVDPASAHDFDDAVSAERTDRGVRLWIHIADVAAHVRPGDALEKEAYRRANSTYVPGIVAPMLPHVLSSDACSLAPDRERLAVTSEIELSEAGEPLSASFYRSLIRSDVRLDYDELDEIFAGRAQPPESIAQPLALARDAAATLAGRRPRSSLEVESFEPEFRFEDGQVVGAHSVPQTEAHR